MATAADVRKTWETQAMNCAENALSLKKYAALLESGAMSREEVLEVAGRELVPCTSAVLARFEKALRMQADATAEFRRQLIRAAVRIQKSDAAGDDKE